MHTKKVILFPGQGSQYKGMGKNLFPKYQSLASQANDILKYDLKELCTKDPDRLLSKTEYTQPALYVVNHFLFLEADRNPDFLIGHSLGEYNALLAAGAFDFETGLRLVKKRGQLMAAASGGGMAAVIGLKLDELKEKLEEGMYNDIDIANLNTPTQIVLSGQKERISALIADFSEKKIRVVPLNVSAPFHSRYMKPAVDEFAAYLESFHFYSLHIPVVANATALPYENAQIVSLLSQQIASSVRWTDSIRFLMGQGVEEYQELGRGILTRMVDEIRNNCSPIKHSKDISSEQPPVVETNSTNGQISVTSSKVPLKIHQKGAPKADPSNSNIDNGALKNDLDLASLLGSDEFRKDYQVRYSYVAGAMYRGIASVGLVINMAKAGMLSFLGTAGMSLKEIGQSIDELKDALGSNHTYGMNMIHHLSDPEMEMKTIELYLQKNIINIEASAFMQITTALVWFHVAGLQKNSEGEIVRGHRIMAKISRPEVAEVFMRPAPGKLIHRLLEANRITEEQANWARHLPVSQDICVEADSGGHTDAGVAMVLLPSIQRLRNDIQDECNYKRPIRIGLAGGIGTPQSIACAFVMGSDFVLTGSINQCTVEAGTSSAVKDLLETINVQDTTYAPAGDMFEIGAKIQVLRKGVLFPARANKLYNLYQQYNSLDEIPQKILDQLEKRYFEKSLVEIWEETKAYFLSKGQEQEIARAEQSPKHKMALVFRWYFSFSSQLAFDGNLHHKVNFQVHTGPSLGAFNQWVKGTELESWRNRNVADIAVKLMNEAASLLESTLKNILKKSPNGRSVEAQ